VVALSLKASQLFDDGGCIDDDYDGDGWKIFEKLMFVFGSASRKWRCLVRCHEA
jgi:hypothetical protein